MKSAYISKRVFVDGPVEPACIVVQDGKILDIIRGEDFERFDRETVTQKISDEIYLLKKQAYKQMKHCMIISPLATNDMNLDGTWNVIFRSPKVIDVGNLVLMPGVVDSHVHVNEPGRSEWEGYITATKAAAAGGITTIIDMPLNSIPSTTTLAALEKKVLSAGDKCYVDVGFWGGIVPGNQVLQNVKESHAVT